MVWISSSKHIVIFVSLTLKKTGGVSFLLLYLLKKLRKCWYIFNAILSLMPVR